MAVGDDPLTVAYAALQRGEFARAEALYRAAEIAAPDRRDVLLGLAALAQSAVMRPPLTNITLRCCSATPMIRSRVRRYFR